jgi:hypothetical protein
MKLRTSLLALLVLAAAMPMAAQTYDWSMVGSTGTPDPAALGWRYTGPTFEMASNRWTNIGLVSRYPVTNTYGSGVDISPAWTTLRLVYTDNSNLGSVVAKLFKVDKCANTETLLCTITSSDGQGVQCGSCQFSSSDIDFANFTYYVEGRLIRSATSATEQLHTVAIE